MGAELRLAAGLGAGPGAGFAGDRGRDAHLRGFAGIGLVELDLHVVAQIGAALATGTATRAAHAKNALEQVGEGGAEIGPETASAPTQALLEGGMAEAVIGSTLVRVFQNLIGLVDFLEAGFARFVVGVAVGMPLHGELAERALELAVIGGAIDFKDLVIAALRHPSSLPRRFCARLVGFYLVIHGVPQKS